MDAYFVTRCFYTALLLPFVLVGMYAFRLARRLDRVGVRTRGTVVEYEAEEPPTCPVVVYVDKAGTHHRVKLLSSKGCPAVGETIDIVYDPDAPGRANVPSSRELWISGAAFFGFGMILGLVIWLVEPNGGH